MTERPSGGVDWLLEGGPRPSIGILTADLARLGEEVALLGRIGAELVHVDVMDGVYCPQLTVGAPIVKAIGPALLRDVHLMVDDPLAKIEPILAAGADIVTVHIERAGHPHRVFTALKDLHARGGSDRPLVRGIGLSPSQPVEEIEPFLDEIEYVLVLAIDPGWSGQAFIPGTLGRIERVRELIDRSGRRIAVGVDGGVTMANVSNLAGLGLDVIVTGSAVFDGNAAEANGRRMLELVRGGSPT
ncbi:MAG TPA: ribulose-phosphate 3-epimerase [Candidatus Limnocylindrales bacterium]